jgi:hypothetical protein
MEEKRRHHHTVDCITKFLEWGVRGKIAGQVEVIGSPMISRRLFVEFTRIFSQSLALVSIF